MTRVEATINSRPITYMYADARDLEPLSPADLLIGKRTTHLPPLTDIDSYSVETTADDLRSRARYREALAEDFWRRWRAEYLPELRRPLKGVSKVETVKPGDVVLVKEERVPRLM